MSEVPLYGAYPVLRRAYPMVSMGTNASAACRTSGNTPPRLHGYLAYEKHPPPRTLQKDHA